MKWVYKVLPNAIVNEICEKHKTSIRIEVYDGSPHLQICRWTKSGAIEYLTVGRIRKSLYKKLDLRLMDKQPGFVNVAWYKFNTTNHQQ